MHSFVKLTVTTFALLAASTAIAQSLYSRAFGRKTGDPVIFLHGGPGSSSVYFEATTAQKLADKGYYVVVYDRRGEGRSRDSTATMNYEEFLEDLNLIYQKYHLVRAHLIGFSFGGLVTTLYAEKYPEKVKSIILTSALVSQQASYNTILSSVQRIYKDRNDMANLAMLDKIGEMDTNSLAYRTSVFAHASQNGFFSLPEPDTGAQQIYATYKTDTLITRYLKNERAVETFWENESQKNIDITPILKRLTQGKMHVYAIYGKQDGLFSEKQIAHMLEITGKSRLKYLDNCSHTVFVDQQEKFLEAVDSWLSANPADN
jgi:proline iminopeptidase